MFALQVAVMKGRGGVLTSIYHYARLFDAAGVRTACLYRGPATDALRAAGIDVIEAPSSLTSALYRLTPDFGRVRAAIRARGGEPDFAMVHSDRALGAVKGMFPNSVVMTRCHSDNTKHKGGADLVVTLNAAQHERVQAALPRSRIKMFGNPFVPKPGEPGPSGEDGPQGRLRINYLGRLQPGKDPATLIKAYAAANLPSGTELRIIGDGPLEEEARREAAGCGKPVSFVGWLATPFAHFDRGDLLVFPSEAETFSWVIREALHHRVPTIASDIHVHRDALGGGAFGLLYPVGDWRALAAALEQAAGNVGEMRSKIERGAEALAAQYGADPFWAAMSAEIADIRRTSAR